MNILTRFARRLLACLVLFSFTLSPLAQAYTFTDTLDMGSRGPDVTALQQTLRTSGHFTYPENTGYFGEATRQAVMAFQRAHNLETVGWVGPQTRALLNQLSEHEPTSLFSFLPDRADGLREGTNDAAVSILQHNLRTLGFFTYPETTTFFGTLTKAALMSFQSANQLAPTGILDSRSRLTITLHYAQSLLATLLAQKNNPVSPTSSESGTEQTLLAPIRFSTSVTSNSIKLTWDTVPGATGYIVSRADGDDSDDFTILTDTLNAPRYTDTEVESRHTYSYQVTAFNNEGAGPASKTITLTTTGGGGGGSSFSVADQTLVFGALTLADAGGIAPTANDTITAATITAGNTAAHWQVAADGTLTPTAQGDTDDLDQAPYALTISFNGGDDTAIITITTDTNTYSASDITEATAAATAIGTAGSGARTIKLRDGSYAEDANFLKNRAYTNTVTVTPHTGAEATFAGIDVVNADNIVLDGLTFYRATGTMLSVRTGSDGVTIQNNLFYGPDIDPTGDYSSAQPPLNIGITKDGTAAPNNLAILNNTFHDVNYPIGWSPMGATGYLRIEGNYIYDFYNDGIKVNYPTGNATTTIADNVIVGAIGNSADFDAPHIDYIQAVGVGDRDWTNFEVLRNIIVNTYSRATPQGIFIDDMTGGYHFKGMKVNGNLIVNTGGATTGIRVRQAEDVEVFGNTVVSQLLYTAAGPGIVIGDDTTAGTHVVRNNVADVITISGTAVTDNNHVAGIGGATISYPTLFAGSTFSPTTRAAALSEFAMKANGPLDADSSGGASTGDAGAVGSGYVTFPSTVPGNDGSFDTAYEADVSAPTLSALSPADDSYGATVASNLTATFNEAVAFDTTVAIALYRGDDTLIESWNAGDIGSGITISSNVLTIDPTSNLTASTSYYVQIASTTIKDTSDNYFAGIEDETTWNFVTASSSYVATAVNFDGSSDYLTRDADLTGVADGKEGLFSVWVNLQGGDGTFMDLFSQGTTTLGLTLERMNTNVWRLLGKDSAGSQRLRLDSLSTYTTATNPGWHHLLFAWNGVTGTAQLYIDDADDLNTANDVAQNVAIDLTQGEFAIGGWPNGSRLMNSDMADLQFWTTYQDISSSTVRRNFISAAGKPVDPDTAEGAYGSALIRLTNPTASWHTNQGTGGGFTENGALTDAASSPSD